MANKPIETPLPADLPENWQRTQTVSPSGTEVGLTQQHGYNYLMQQVNAAQEGVNALNDAFPSLYGTDSVPAEILAKIGAQSTTNLLVNPRLKYNSRDRASYTGAAWTADGWYASAGMSLAGKSLTASAAGATLSQPVKHGDQYLGQEVTASVLVQGQDVLSCTCTLPASTPAASTTYGTASAAWGSLTVSYDATASAFRVSVGVANGTSVTWVGAKLEAGGASTLEAELASPPPEDVEKLRLDLYDLDPGRCAYLPWHNENLLDNWYFVGGGSQQGGGQFPINQRGQTSYTGEEHGIDRWALDPGGGGVSCTLNPGSIRLQQTAVGAKTQSMSELIESSEILENKTYTFSVLCSGEGRSQLLFFANNQSLFLSAWGNTAQPTLHTLTFTTPQITSDIVGFYIYADVSGDLGYTDIYAAKLELGHLSTLARKEENGNWVLNDPPPNFQQELAKCQRYQIYYSGNSTIPISMYSNDNLWAIIYLPCPLRAVPTILTDTIGVFGNGTGISTPITGFTFNYFLKGNILIARATKAGHGLTNLTATVQLNSSLLDANL